MKAVLDACVLFPTVLREILTDSAGAGLYAPVWSERILDEWRYAAGRVSSDAARIAGVEIALLQDRFPTALGADDGVAALGLDLPDPADRHVLETALDVGADLIVTANLRDFPRRALAAVGVKALHPDEFLLDLYACSPEAVGGAVMAAHDKALMMGGDMSMKDLMKRARLPRLGRAMQKFGSG